MRIIKYNKRNQTGSVTYQSVEVQQVAQQVTSLSNQLNDWFTMDDNGVLVSNYSLASTSQVSSNYIIEQQADIKIYDSKIEYLQSTGTQYIDTGIIPDANTGAKVTVMKLSTTDRYILGLRNNSGNTRWTIGQIQSKLYYGYGGFYSNEWNNAPINTQVTASLNYLNDKKFIVEDESAVIPTLSFTPIYSILLFGYNNKGTVGYCDCRIYNVKISQGDEIVMDLIPVRVGTTGYMYDTVSGELFGNAGTGEFILGSDIV